jgi:hypothetical protein
MRRGRSGGTGRRGGLKIRCPQGRQGSSPCSGTTEVVRRRSIRPDGRDAAPTGKTPAGRGSRELTRPRSCPLPGRATLGHAQIVAPRRPEAPGTPPDPVVTRKNDGGSDTGGRRARLFRRRTRRPRRSGSSAAKRRGAKGLSGAAERSDPASLSRPWSEHRSCPCRRHWSRAWRTARPGPSAVRRARSEPLR